MSSLKQATVKVNDDKALIAKLRRLNQIEKDEHGEFLWAMVDGESFKMYLDHERTLPSQFAGALLAGYAVPLDRECQQCRVDGEPTGYTVAGMCHVCKGNKFIDMNRTVRTFVASGEVDLPAFDVRALPPPSTKKPASASR